MAASFSCKLFLFHCGWEILNQYIMPESQLFEISAEGGGIEINDQNVTTCGFDNEQRLPHILFILCVKGSVSWRDFVSFPLPYPGPIGYNTTTDDATAAFACVQRMRNGSVRRTSVCFANTSAHWPSLARADPVNQVYSFTCSCPKEDVDGVNQYLPWYNPFKDSSIRNLYRLWERIKACNQNLVALLS